MVSDQESFNQVEKVLEDRLNEIADFIFSKSQENIVSKKCIDEGTLLKSGNVVRGKNEVSIVYTAPHAKPVEFGTDPHMPPVEPIVGWCKRKLSLNDKDAKSVAWAIAKSIEKNGSEPKFFMRDAINLAKSKYSGVLYGFE